MITRIRQDFREGEEPPPSSGYNLSLSLLRIAATVAIVFLHTSGTLSDNPDRYLLSAESFLFYTRMCNLSCWAVPCFMMITGALFLQQEKKLTVRRCLHYVWRMVLALILFGVPYALLNTFYEAGTITIRDIPSAFVAILENRSWSHLWYLYMLIGAYLLMPILKTFTDHCSKQELRYACCLILFFDCLLPVLHAGTGIQLAVSVWLPLQPCGYLLLGHLLSENPPKGRAWIPAVCAVCSLAVIWCLFGVPGSGLVGTIQNCLVVFTSICVFCLFLSIRAKASERTRKTLWRLDRLCFGVYLVHPVFFHFLYDFLKVTPADYGDSILVILLCFMGFTVCSFAASFVMSLIPPLWKYVL